MWRIRKKIFACLLIVWSVGVVRIVKTAPSTGSLTFQIQNLEQPSSCQWTLSCNNVMIVLLMENVMGQSAQYIFHIRLLPVWIMLKGFIVMLMQMLSHNYTHQKSCLEWRQKVTDRIDSLTTSVHTALHYYWVTSVSCMLTKWQSHSHKLFLINTKLNKRRTCFRCVTTFVRQKRAVTSSRPPVGTTGSNSALTKEDFMGNVSRT